MITYLLLVLTYSTGRVEHIPFHSKDSCTTAAEQLRVGIPRNVGFVDCVKDEVPHG